MTTESSKIYGKNSVTNGNVILIEPNDININTNLVNGIPQYQDMYIFAELTAKSKGRTVIVNSNASSIDSKKVNFLGNNQDDIDNPNYLNFTTNYYDGSTEDNTHYEGFGINNIKIVINSSFIPQVNIQFIDIRGLAFFNQKDSPYRILFDFPPPMFTLTVKGYYGKAITYQLHLVKYISEFSAQNGNFIIDAQFVARTFAPLTDILFRYVVNAPLINNKESLTPNTGEAPRNTYEFILKLKSLYKAYSNKKDTDTDNKKRNAVLDEIDTINDIFWMLDQYNESEILKKGGESLRLVIKSPKEDVVSLPPALRASEKYDLRIIETVKEYNAIIEAEKTSGTKSRPPDRLVILYVVGTNLPLLPTDYDSVPTEDSYIFKPFKYETKNYKTFSEPLAEYTKILIANNLPSFGITKEDILVAKPFTNPNNITSLDQVETEYYGLDITDYYYKLYKRNQVLNNENDELSVIIAEKINNMVAQTLGMVPSIYNIFKIILDDVDSFFSILKTTSMLAENKHNTTEAKSIIAGNNIDSPVSSGNVPDHIYPFPLVLKESNVYGGTKKERIAPITLSKDTEFPELDLVTDFMDTFLLQNKILGQYTARDNQSDDGTYKWIPVSPFDSTLGGASPQSPYLDINDDVRTEILKIFLKRYYILTQGTLPDAFYDSGLNNAYSKLYANAEAVNLVSTFITPQIAETIKVMVGEYLLNIQKFYDDVKLLTDTYEGATINLYDFPADTIEFFPITPSNTDTGRVYVDKNDNDFEGVHLYDSQIIVQEIEESGGSTNPVDNFTSSIKRERWSEKIFKRYSAEKYYEFSEQNVIYLRDSGVEKYDVVINGLSTYTRYLYSHTENPYTWQETNENTGESITKTNKFFPGNKNPVLGQKIAYQEGNISFKDPNKKPKRSLTFGENLMELWTKMLGMNDDGIIDTLQDTTSSGQSLTNMLILSNFGFTMSPFNIYPNELSSSVFDVPAAVEVPSYYAPYIGMLLTAVDKGWDDDILTYFTGTTGDNGVGSVLDNKGFFVLADLHDVANHLSVKDKEVFRVAYQDFESSLSRIRNRIIDLIDVVNDNSGEGKPFFSVNSLAFNYYLNSIATPSNAIGKGTYSDIIENVLNRKGLINYSQITFSILGSENTYVSLKTSNLTQKESNNKFFKEFFNRVKGDIEGKKTELKEEEKALRKAKGDENIISQLYYSFKNINDKWLTGNANSEKNYPFNMPNKKLIDSFAFVDRGMNPIGETILNGEILIDLLNDPNVSLFTVLSQLLSLNNFVFFPLQNFMSFDSKGWEDSFKIHTDGVNNNIHTAFICMYIGGSASYPSVASNGFVNDGIIDISEPGVTDFSTKKLTEEEIDELRKVPFELLNENEKQILSNSVPFQEVRAFRVRFGEQNQSMFQDIKIDSKEYPETNESIQILSRLAGDNNPDAPIPIGQNLYNLYENRSYKATVTGFGNAMIQPTQYFQLENIPLFNGAYIILTVEHNITANKMTTSFAGTKLLRFPVPRILTPVAFTEHRNDLTPGAAIQAALEISNRDETHYNSMYNNTPNSLKVE